MKPDRDPLARLCDLDDPDEVRQVEVLRCMWSQADEIVANAKQNAEHQIANAERLAGRMRDRVHIGAREITRRQGRARVQDGLRSIYRAGSYGRKLVTA